MSARFNALSKLLAHADEGDDDFLKKHSPKAVEIDVTAAGPKGAKDDEADQVEGLPPELLAKLMETLKAHAPKLSDGGLLEGADMADIDAMKAREDARNADDDANAEADTADLAADAEDPKVKSGKDAKEAVAKLSDGGLIEGDSLNDERLKSRQEQRDADKDAETKAAMDQLAADGGDEDVPRSRSRVAKMRSSRYSDDRS